MSSAWHPAIVVDEELARGLIRDQFPGIACARLRPFGTGWDNTAFLVDDRYVFRFPRRSVAVPLVEREIALLSLLGPQLTVPIPSPRFAGRPSAAYPWPFAGYERLPGETASSRALSDDDRLALAPRLGAFLRSLHAIDPAAARERGLPADEIGRLDPARRLPLATERLAELSAAGLVPDAERFVGFLAAHPPAPCALQTIVHGDLYERHVLVDASHRLAGIIDWGDLHVGDPALDLAIAVAMLPAQARAAFTAAYGAISDDTWERAAYRAVYHSALCAQYGYRADDPEMLRLGLAGLARALPR